MDLSERIQAVRAKIAAAAAEVGRDPGEITLEAATKTQDADTVRSAIQAGITVCGENRVQELCQKLDQFAYDGAAVHFIGHLQTNKVKYVVGKVALIHSISSEKLLRAVSAQADKLGLVQDVLLEINLAGEASKSGFTPEEAPPAAALCAQLPGVRLRGLMCIPPAAGAPGENLPYFQNLHQIAVDITREILDNKTDMDVLSMGMSGDWPDAVAAGSTCIRVGSALFGPRPPMSPGKG